MTNTHDTTTAPATTTATPKTFAFLVEVTADTEEQAQIVMRERMGYDEMYDDDSEGGTGEPFDYTIGRVELTATSSNEVTRS